MARALHDVFHSLATCFPMRPNKNAVINFFPYQNQFNGRSMWDEWTEWTCPRIGYQDKAHRKTLERSPGSSFKFKLNQKSRRHFCIVNFEMIDVLCHLYAISIRKKIMKHVLQSNYYLKKNICIFFDLFWNNWRLQSYYYIFLERWELMLISKSSLIDCWQITEQESSFFCIYFYKNKKNIKSSQQNDKTLRSLIK